MGGGGKPSTTPLSLARDGWKIQSTPPARKRRRCCALPAQSKTRLAGTLAPPALEIRVHRGSSVVKMILP